MDQLTDLMEGIKDLEEQYGIIAKKVDEHKIKEKSSKLTIDHRNAEHMIDAVKGIAETYEHAKKTRKL